MPILFSHGTTVKSMWLKTMKRSCSKLVAIPEEPFNSRSRLDPGTKVFLSLFDGHHFEVNGQN